MGFSLKQPVKFMAKKICNIFLYALRNSQLKDAKKRKRKGNEHKSKERRNKGMKEGREGAGIIPCVSQF